MSSKRDAILKPFQLIGIALAFAVFSGAVAVFTTRNVMLAIVGGGGIFIISLVVLAMLVLSYKPNDDAEVYLDRFEPDASRSDSVSDGASTGVTSTDASAAEVEEPASDPIGGGVPGDDPETPTER